MSLSWFLKAQTINNTTSLVSWTHQSITHYLLSGLIVYSSTIVVHFYFISINCLFHTSCVNLLTTTYFCIALTYCLIWYFNSRFQNQQSPVVIFSSFFHCCLSKIIVFSEKTSDFRHMDLVVLLNLRYCIKFSNQNSIALQLTTLNFSQRSYK